MELVVSSRIKNSCYTINLKDLKKQEITIDCTNDNVGLYCMAKYNDKVVLGSEYGVYFYILSINKLEVQKVYAGSGVKEVKTYKDKAYLLCSDINAILVYDFLSNEIIFEIPTPNYPFDFDINLINSRVYVCSVLEDSISVFDANSYEDVAKIEGINCPVCVKCLGDNLFVIHHGEDNDKGYLQLFKSDDFLRKDVYEIGKGPFSINSYGDVVYVTSGDSGRLFYLDMSKGKIDKLESLNIGVIPFRVDFYEDNIFVLDYYLGHIISIDKNTHKTKSIAKVKEPTAMIIC